MNIPFSPPFINDAIKEEVLEVLNSGWITTGPKTKLLEDLICEKYRCKKAVAVNSWTSGMITFLKWIGLKEGDEVIIPAYTYSATALSVIHAGAKPIMVDVLPDFTIDIKAIENAITSRTKVIVPVDFAGLPADYNAINNLVDSDKIKKLFHPENEFQKKLGRILVISDAAHSIGGKYNNKNVCELTDVTILSLHAVKNVTSAEGGVICLNLPEPFNNEELYPALRRFTLNGQTKDAFSKTQVGAWRYDIVELGMKCNMADLNAALALGQLKQYEEMLAERKKIFFKYNQFFAKQNWAELPVGIDETRESSYHLYPLRIKGITEEVRDNIISDVSLTGVAVNVHFIPMPMLTAFKNLGYNISDYPVSYNNYSREISLPIYPQLSDEAVEYICSAIQKAVEKTAV
jgi:dTDP-4-amino-4,6-dideoxygalactose transaminase